MRLNQLLDPDREPFAVENRTCITVHSWSPFSSAKDERRVENATLFTG